MAQSAWTFTDADHEFFARHVASFLPDRIFDAHAHLFCHAHYAPGTLPANLAETPQEAGFELYARCMDALHGTGRTLGGLFFGLAFTGDRAGNNAFVAQEVAQACALGFQAYGQLVIAPDAEPDAVQEQVRRGGFVGLKPYHTMAQVEGPTFLAPIEAYLTEDHVRIAHEERLTITLHMVRERALADPVNQATIRRYCERYPNMRLILAHAARGFNPWHTIEGIEALAGLPNVWFDTSAVTEAGAFEAIVDTFGHTRLLYGTDFYISHLRGRCIALGDSFHWLYAEEMELDEKHTTLRPVLIGLESLRSVALACRRLRLADPQIEDIFFHNADRLYR
jgi:predicted TIM-barrel fold metal-dependent hydrolase